MLELGSRFLPSSLALAFRFDALPVEGNMGIRDVRIKGCSVEPPPFWQLVWRGGAEARAGRGGTGQRGYTILG